MLANALYTQITVGICCREVRKALRQKYFGDSPSFNVLLTTDSFIMKDCTHLRRVHWEYLIVDEAHR